MGTLLSNAYARAAEHLKQNEKELHRLAEALVEYETLSADEIQMAIVGKSKQIAVIRKEKEDAEKIVNQPPPAKEAVSKKPPNKRRPPIPNPAVEVPQDGAEGAE